MYKIITEDIEYGGISVGFKSYNIGSDRYLGDTLLPTNVDNCLDTLKKMISTSIYLVDDKSQVLASIIRQGYLDDDESASFIVKDIYSIIDDLDENKFIGISEILEFNRTIISSKGDGSIILNEFLRNMTYDNVIYVLKAASECCYQFTPKDIVDENNKKLVKFYENLGFMNINDYVGYENSVAMIWIGNKIGKYVYDKYFHAYKILKKSKYITFR